MDDIVNSVPSWMFTAIIAVCILFIIGIIFARLYRRASAEQAFVRTGLGGQKVVMSGGAIVMPIFHEIIPINMNTLKLEVSRSTIDSLITKDRMRVDVVVAFFVRVKPSVEGIATAAQTLGQRTLSPEDLRMLVEDKFVDALGLEFFGEVARRKRVAERIADESVACHGRSGWGSQGPCHRALRAGRHRS